MKFNNSKDKDNSNMKKFEDKNFRGIVFSKEKILFVVGLVMMVFSSCISVFAASFLYNSNEVSFNNSSSPSISSNNVQGAIDELYSAASDYSALQSRVAALEDRWGAGQSYSSDGWLNVLANSGNNSGIGLFDNNSKIRGLWHYNPTLDETRLIANNSSGSEGQGKLILAGKPITINANAGGTGDINLNGNVKVNGTDVSTKVNQALTPTRGSGSIKYYCYGSTCMVKLANYNPGSITARTTVATVPAGYRPISEVTGFLGGSSNCGMGVTDAGAVWVEPSCANTGVYLNVTYPKMQ